MLMHYITLHSLLALLPDYPPTNQLPTSNQKPRTKSKAVRLRGNVMHWSTIRIATTVICMYTYVSTSTLSALYAYAVTYGTKNKPTKQHNEKRNTTPYHIRSDHKISIQHIPCTVYRHHWRRRRKFWYSMSKTNVERRE